MKLFDTLRTAVAAALLALAAMLPSEGALAQVVTQLPVYIDASTSSGPVAPTDLGNGPLEFKVLQGNGILFSSSGTGVGSTSGASTTLTLTATPSTPPCVGCIISGAGITSGTTVAAFNGTTTITLSAAMTVAASTPLAWGAACPSTVTGVKGVLIQPGQPTGGDYPFYTQARLCGYSGNAPGLTVLPFAIGAH
jgi:hypothetical protein